MKLLRNSYKYYLNYDLQTQRIMQNMFADNLTQFFEEVDNQTININAANPKTKQNDYTIRTLSEKRRKNQKETREDITIETFNKPNVRKLLILL